MQSQLDCTIWLDCFFQLDGQDRTDQLIGFALGADQVSQRISNKCCAPIRSGQPLCILQDMWMGA